MGFSAIVVSCKIKKCALQVATPVFIGNLRIIFQSNPYREIQSSVYQLFNIILFSTSAILRANSERKLQKTKAKQPKPPRFLSSFTHPQGGWCKGTHLFRICKCAEGFYQLINDRACTYPLFLRLCHNPFTGFLADSPAYGDTLFAEPLATCAFAPTSPV